MHELGCMLQGNDSTELGEVDLSQSRRLVSRAARAFCMHQTEVVFIHLRCSGMVCSCSHQAGLHFTITTTITRRNDNIGVMAGPLGKS